MRRRVRSRDWESEGPPSPVVRRERERIWTGAEEPSNGAGMDAMVYLPDFHTALSKRAYSVEKVLLLSRCCTQ